MAKSLNFLDAVKMASILTKYITPEIVENNSLSFVGNLVRSMEPMDYLHCVQLLSEERITGREGGQHFLSLLLEGFEKNKVLSLVGYFRKVGIV